MQVVSTEASVKPLRLRIDALPDLAGQVRSSRSDFVSPPDSDGTCTAMRVTNLRDLNATAFTVTRTARCRCGVFSKIPVATSVRTEPLILCRASHFEILLAVTAKGRSPTRGIGARAATVHLFRAYSEEFAAILARYFFCLRYTETRHAAVLPRSRRGPLNRGLTGQASARTVRASALNDYFCSGLSVRPQPPDEQLCNLGVITPNHARTSIQNCLSHIIDIDSASKRQMKTDSYAEIAGRIYFHGELWILRFDAPLDKLLEGFCLLWGINPITHYHHSRSSFRPGNSFDCDTQHHSLRITSHWPILERN